MEALVIFRERHSSEVASPSAESIRAGIGRRGSKPSGFGLQLRLRGFLIFRHRSIDLLESKGWENIRLRIGVPAIPGTESPQSLVSRGPFHQQVRMSRVDFYRELQHMERPDRSRRPRVFDGHFALNRAANMTQQPAVGAFMRTSLTHRQGEDQNQGGKHRWTPHTWIATAIAWTLSKHEWIRMDQWD